MCGISLEKVWRWTHTDIQVAWISFCSHPKYSGQSAYILQRINDFQTEINPDGSKMWKTDCWHKIRKEWEMAHCSLMETTEPEHTGYLSFHGLNTPWIRYYAFTMCQALARGLSQSTEPELWGWVLIKAFNSKISWKFLSSGRKIKVSNYHD
jgi:hypothetical protein